MNSIPLVDLSGWFDGDGQQRAALAAEVDTMLQRLGFLVVTNHGIDQAMIDRCRSEVTAFFHQPEAAKAKVAMDLSGGNPAYRGWVASGLESNAATYGIETPPDLKETFTCGPVTVRDERLRTDAPRWFAPNLWPDRPEGFKPAVEAWWLAARALADELLDIFSLALGLPIDHLRNQCLDTTADATFNWYGPGRSVDQQPGQFRVGPHTDFGSLTILDRQPGMGGLQVQDESGNWIDAPYVDGGLVVNTGDLLRRWTNDRWESNQHRVLPPPVADPDEELVSLILFHEPDHDADITALETCVSEDNPARYPGVSSSDYLAAKMDALVVAETTS